jgi:phosphate transport system permease protein
VPQTSRQRLLTRASDATARWVITLGGLLTIGSLVLMFLLIVRESLPLFARADVKAVGATEVEGSDVLADRLRAPEGGGPPVDPSRMPPGERVASWARSENDLAVGTEGGRVLFFSLENEDAPALSGNVVLDAKAPARVGAVAFLLGGQTILAGDDRGRLYGLMRVRATPEAEERTLVVAHAFEPQAAPLTALAPATRGKLFLAGDASGRITVRNATTERIVAGARVAGPVSGLVMARRSDGFAARGASGVSFFTLQAPHHEVSWRTLFGRVWYEGYDQPAYVWQSSGATDDVEPKLSFVPLVFGTLKGTLYAMLVAVPVGILAALYTSLFAPAGVRAFVKPTIEIMAALPSVVVGFLAGLWLAPMLERNTLATLLLVPLVPAVVFCGALLFQRVPAQKRRLLPNGAEIAFVAALALLAAWTAFAVAPLAERVLFQGDFKGWLLSALSLRYDTRNCLVIGFAMGLAVVPIVFTISEDALSSVPQSLKAASLALGATAWQTATRVVLPTASAGIFSAVMLGFGRAVGETMIVLMATGNTPVLDWSMFNGMRTLSANIAVEIPEAPHGGTLYRLLFLSALLLFALTFIVNTVAELMRQRLRRKYSVI